MMRYLPILSNGFVWLFRVFKAKATHLTGQQFTVTLFIYFPNFTGFENNCAKDFLHSITYIRT